MDTKCHYNFTALYRYSIDESQKLIIKSQESRNKIMKAKGGKYEVLFCKKSH
ncbi:MAG: hypothetical protein JWQ66_4131 [Mucilaginibacter sp.]|nr:hypothetical protein [Mucilaginibacter sp.]